MKKQEQNIESVIEIKNEFDSEQIQNLFKEKPNSDLPKVHEESQLLKLENSTKLVHNDLKECNTVKIKKQHNSKSTKSNEKLYDWKTEKWKFHCKQMELYCTSRFKIS